ncbi:hypothetical protein [Parasediminibacterium sp. JCM 36343]|uniref:hypothetical protein n=1 Tax=Parasediminibacterium sp. JCM 36343 TaxID=3374279 RepID=UPI003977EDFE
MKDKETEIVIANLPNSKGAVIFKKMSDEKKAIRAHIQNGGKISELKGKFNIVKTVSITAK